MWDNKVEGNINKINISREGKTSIITEGTSYKSIIITFDKNGKELFKTYLASTIAIDVDISMDGKYLAIAEVNTNGALIESSIKVIEIDKASSGDTTNSIIYKHNADANKMITDIKYQEKGQLICIYDDSIHMIYEENETTILEFGKNVQMSSIDLKGCAVRAEEISTGLFSSRTDIILTNTLSKAESTYSVDSVIKDLVSCNQVVAINLGTEIHLINLNRLVRKEIHIITRN